MKISIALIVLALSGCSAVSSLTDPASLPSVNATTSSSEPAWGAGWVHSDGPLPVKRPDAAANERLADAMAASGYHWTGTQKACLNKLWTKVSEFDNFWTDDVYSGIAGLSGHVKDPYLPADPSVKQIQASGWYAAQPYVQIAEGLADIQVFWGSPCAEWARDENVPAASYPSGRVFAGSLSFTVRNGRLALDTETQQQLCGSRLAPIPNANKSCRWITSKTTWPL